MNRVTQFIILVIVSSAPYIAQAASTPTDADEQVLRNLMSTILLDTQAASVKSASDISASFISVLRSSGLAQSSGSNPPSLEQIFSVIPRPPLPEAPFINMTTQLQGAVDAAVLNMVSSSLSLASGICNAASTVISINAGQISLGIAEWNVVAAAANSAIQSYQLDQALYGDVNSYLSKPDPLTSALSSLKTWESTKQQIKSSLTGQLTQLDVVQKILKAISPS